MGKAPREFRTSQMKQNAAYFQSLKMSYYYLQANKIP
jgi:hypothetical protein